MLCNIIYFIVIVIVINKLFTVVYNIILNNI